MPDSSTKPIENSFLADVLKPGFSLNPTFIAILDAVFTCLFLVLLSLAYLTSGDLNVFGLMAIELGLWGSLKWFVKELRKAREALEHAIAKGRLQEEFRAESKENPAESKLESKH